eukprot:COSAG01_NODE_62502_length_284_cov_0.843243_1_plen_45_part_10
MMGPICRHAVPVVAVVVAAPAATPLPTGELVVAVASRGKPVAPLA